MADDLSELESLFGEARVLWAERLASATQLVAQTADARRTWAARLSVRDVAEPVVRAVLVSMHAALVELRWASFHERPETVTDATLAFARALDTLVRDGPAAYETALGSIAVAGRHLDARRGSSPARDASVSWEDVAVFGNALALACRRVVQGVEHAPPADASRIFDDLEVIPLDVLRFGVEAVVARGGQDASEVVQTLVDAFLDPEAASIA